MLKGKTAVITGCLQGIGRETMRVFAKNRCNIFACSLAKTNEFEKEIKELQKKYNIKIYPIYFDLSDINAIRSAAETIQKEQKSIDILVNIAGITKDAIFQMITMEQMIKVFQINFFSQILFSQYMVKLISRSGKGSVIFISSITGVDGNRGQLVYGASKAAIISATKTMAQELAINGIRVNAVAPGVIKTAMTKNISEEIIKSKLENSKLKRIGLPEEVASLILFLASDNSDYITGQVIRIDGGIN